MEGFISLKGIYMTMIYGYGCNLMLCGIFDMFDYGEIVAKVTSIFVFVLVSMWDEQAYVVKDKIDKMERMNRDLNLRIKNLENKKQ